MSNTIEKALQRKRAEELKKVQAQQAENNLKRSQRSWYPSHKASK